MKDKKNIFELIGSAIAAVLLIVGIIFSVEIWFYLIPMTLLLVFMSINKRHMRKK